MEATSNTSAERDEEKASPEPTPDAGNEHDSARKLPPKYSCGFLDPRLKVQRGIFLKATGLGTLLSCIAIFGFLSIYWGALFSINDKIPNLNGFVVDLDGGEVGQLITSSFLQVSGSYGQMTWTAESFADSDAAAEAVRENEAWAAVVINQDATANLNAATNAADASYNGSSAITVLVNQARNQQAFSYISNAYQPVLLQVTKQYAAQRARSLSSSSSLATLLSQAPSIVTSPISFTTNDLLPFDVPAAIATTFVGLIYLNIFAFTLTMQGFGGRAAIQPYLDLQSLLALRLLAPFIGYFVLSLAYALMNYAFQIPFDRKFGDGGFVLFWIACWLAMLALGFALEAMITLLTGKFISFFLLLLIVCQVAVSLYPLELLPRVYRYGEASVYLNFSETARTIIFATKNKVGQNLGILVAWFVVSLCTTTLFTTLVFRREVRKSRG